MKKILVVAALLGLSTAAVAQEGKQLLWGDTHLHTTYSSDAFANNNLSADPDTAYRFAMGLPVIHPYHRARVQIETPLDFLVVSDHAEYLGVIRHVYYEGADTEGLGPLATIKAKIAEWIFRRALDGKDARSLFIDVLPVAEDPRQAAAAEYENRGRNVGWLPPMPAVEVDTWNSITSAADRYNNPGVFTAMIGWEWSSIPGGANLHRVVLTDAGADVARTFQPFGLDDSPYPEDLWAWLDATSAATGADFLAIPHNSNISKGFMFDTKTLRGADFSPEYIDQRRKWERIAEITQIKGDSETHPDLSPQDEFADFETYPFYIQREPTPYIAAVGDYLRPALRRGLELERQLGANPYQLGFIGSTDAHTALSSAEEDNFMGKLATDSIPENKNRRFGKKGGAYGWGMSASGRAAVWAGANTREEIFAAMKRREVYATTGPRIAVQFFGGWGFSEADLGATDLYAQATAHGVPMGGELVLPAQDARAPAFILQALKDPANANLDRLQIIKGWVDGAGVSHEQVYDVAWSGEREPGPDGKLPAVGNTVDVTTGRYTNSIGAPQLTAVWQDPAFDPSQAAFYYARVLQIPTPRHSLYDALALGGEQATGRPDSIQERAYTSPIWFQPRRD
ncbi:MAG: DUF3604 domain-containing protein [Gammaproteobacteria bacterium]|nr:DUF3604 domain-containing protein [Gammaproteobacteria bacterium]